MRFKTLALFFTILMFASVSTWGQSSITLDAVTGLYNTDTLKVNDSISFLFRLQQNEEELITGFSNGFRIYSPQGATWNTTTGAHSGAITVGVGQMMSSIFVNSFSITGADADTIGFGGFVIFEPGLENGFNDTVWSINIGPLSAEDNGKQICVDSAFYRPSNTWLWSSDNFSIVPAWDGPHCFTIFDPLAPTPNKDPVLGLIGAKTIDENVLLNFPVAATDDDGEVPVLTMVNSNLPAGANFTDNGNGTGSFSWTPTYSDAGEYSATFAANDGVGGTDSETVVFTVVNVNRAPVLDAIGNKTTDETVQLTFTISATDADGETLVTGLTSNLPASAASAFTDNGDGTGTFDWTPLSGDGGVYSATFFATDQIDTTSEIISITVNSFNIKPVMDSIGDKTVAENMLLEFSFSATDGDGDIPLMKISFTDLPVGYSFIDDGTGTGHFSWTPTFDDAGVYEVIFSAVDTAFTPDDSAFELITITVTNVNRPPVIDSLADMSVDEGVNLAFTVMATDEDGEIVQMTTEGAVGASYTDNNDNTGSFSWTPTFDQAGIHPVSFYAFDGEVVDTVTINITVNEINRNPVLDPIGDKSVEEGSSLFFVITASDDDGDLVNFSMINTDLPSDAQLVDTNIAGMILFLWITTPADAGTYTATILVEDGNGGSDQETISITVSDINFPPIIEPVADFEITECDTIDYLFTASNSDGDSLILDMAPLADNMYFTDNGDGTGRFVFSPTFAQSGVYSLVFSASDGIAIAVDSFDIIVSNCQPGTEGDTVMYATVPAVPGSTAQALWRDAWPFEPDGL